MAICSLRCGLFTAGLIFFTLINIPQILLMLVDDDVRLFIEEVAEEVALAGARGGGRGAHGRMRSDAVRRFLQNNNDGNEPIAQEHGTGGGDTTANQKVVSEGQQLLADGIRTLSLPLVQRGLDKGANPNVMDLPDGTLADQSRGESGMSPLYVLASRNDPADFPQVRAIALRLLMDPLIAPNGNGLSWTPLKAAVANGNLHLVTDLMGDKRTIPEVDVAGLDCAVLKMDLPVSLKWIIPNENIPEAMGCFAALPKDKVVREADSVLMRNLKSLQQLKQAMEKLAAELGGVRKGKGTAASAPKTSFMNTADAGNAAPSAPAVDPRNPFIALPPGLYPPRDTMMMNPSPFRSIATASAYYFLGPPPPIVVSCALVVSVALALALVTATLRQVVVSERARAQFELEAEKARLKEREAAALAKLAAQREKDAAAAAVATAEEPLARERSVELNEGSAMPKAADDVPEQHVSPTEGATETSASASSSAAASAGSTAAVIEPKHEGLAGTGLHSTEDNFFADDDEIRAHDERYQQNMPK